MMTLEELTQLMACYEAEHPVEDYRFYDWNVWPLLRTTILDTAWDSFHHQDYRFKAPSAAARFRSRLKKLIVDTPVAGNAALYLGRVLAIRKAQMACKELQDLDAERSESVVASGRDVVILSFSHRRQPVKNSLYEVYADPLVETLNALGVSALVWERCEERWPRCLPSAWISRLLVLESLKAAALPVLSEPPWFKEIRSCAESLTGKPFHWSGVETTIRQVQRISCVFQSWLEQTGAKMLVVVGWYGGEVMGATLAARRLGVTSVDLQHGIQFSGHYGYAGWKKVPAHGYEIVPDVFWCWGEEPAQRLLRDNPAFLEQSRVIVGGNLWFNKWRAGEVAGADELHAELRRAAAAGKKTILVTLQPLGDQNKLIAEAIALAPRDWFWFLRFHPGTSDSERLFMKGLLTADASAQVDFDLANEAPLYSLLSVCDVHITGLSTCAQEALGFGIPSVIMAEEGRELFRAQLDKGVMLYAANAEEVVSMVQRSEGIENGSCLDASHEIFAPQQQCLRNIAEFLSPFRERKQSSKGGLI
jgi:hypothetical protein